MILATVCVVCGGEGGGHNLVNVCIDFFHVSEHLEQVEESNFLTDGGYPTPSE